MDLKINLHEQDLNTLRRILKSNKRFFLFNLSEGKIISYKFTNELTDRRNNTFNNFRVLSILQSDIKNNL